MRFSKHDMECIAEAKARIDADISKHYTIVFIAEKTGIGKAKLKKGFKYVNGCGLYAYLSKQRMLKAAELLATTEKSLKEIARLTGFSYSSNFTSAFTARYKLTPTKYRQLHNKNLTSFYLP